MTRPCPFDLGIQKNAQALQHMLKHPLVYRSSKPRLDTLQKHYVPKEKRVSLHLTVRVNCPWGPSGTEMAVTWDLQEPCFSLVPLVLPCLSL